ncbi:TIGR02757 family protein [Leptospira ilyithenensis]|uniref:TIGR02757 family protein n=1 Tax=Leptospira ilyithenensis TaxID=2484901 RepID=A0A4R9LKK6_9LEPT|nr:TIGR02757 family protein [Leptospira ilyithenensis]TGN08115.1 TIGR02757 family protein [Leptospira ilyithenensis]
MLPNPKQKNLPKELKSSLDEAIREYSDIKYLSTDPIIFAHGYKDAKDKEIISLFSALYAYGNVKAIKQFLTPLFENLGPHPYDSIDREDSYFEDCIRKMGYYRFQTKEDNRNFLRAIAKLIHKFKPSNRDMDSGILEGYFLDSENRFDPIPGIARFQETLQNEVISLNKTNKIASGLKFLIGEPNSVSAKKRICLFLRWMVRSQFPDFAIYKIIRANELPFPLDVHIQRLIKILGISERKTFGMKEAIDVRNFFKNLNPEDPLLYDFYLTRIGMIQKCKGVKIESICSGCKIRKVCKIGSATGN